MKKEIYFTETQTVGPWWLWLIVAGIGAGLVGLSILKLRKISMKARPGAFGWYLVLATFMFSSIFGAIFMMMLRMETEINSTSIKTRLFPIEFSYHEIFWSDVDRYYMRTYSPFSEFGGWGVRGFQSKDAALNFWGDVGLQLHAKNGLRLLIGTQDPDRLEEALKGL